MFLYHNVHPFKKKKSFFYLKVNRIASYTFHISAMKIQTSNFQISQILLKAELMFTA